MRTTTAVLIVLAACSKHAEPPPPAPAKPPVAATPTQTPVPAADAAVAAAHAHAGSGSGSGSGLQPTTPAEIAAAVTFRSAMKHGRKATDAKAYAEAIAAFDEALKARPNEPHALAERGFAKLLAGADLDAASADFDHAADATREPKLLGMIWFNRGLTDDKLGRPDAALVDYYLANQLLPSKTAAGKLAGKTVCPVRISAPSEIRADPPIDTPDWLALAKAMDALDDLGQPATSDVARAAMTGSDAAPTLPDTVVVGGYAGKTAYVIAARAGKLRAVAVAQEAGGRCPGAVGAEILGAVGDLVYVRAEEQTGGGMTPMCHRELPGSADGEVYECTGADNEDHQGTACDATGTTVRDVVIDMKTGHRVLVAEQQAPSSTSADEVNFKDPRLVQATLAADGLHLAGLGCDQVVPVGAK